MPPTRLIAAGFAAVLGSCGGGSASRGDAEDRPPDPCATGDVLACVADARAGCAGNALRPRRLRYDTHPPTTVGPDGLIRLDHLGGRLLGTDSTRWLACFDGCPAADGGDGAGGPICFPVALPLRVSWPVPPDCRRQERAAGPWRGQASRTVDLACEDGAHSLRVVPGLDAVRTALVRAGAIDDADVLAGLDGLAVEMSASGGARAELVELEDATCSDFDVPAGHRIAGDREAFADLESIAAEPAARLSAEIEKLRSSIAAEAVLAAKAELLPQFREQHGEACRKAGADPANDAELEACVATLPETEAPFRAAAARATARLLAGKRQEIDELTRRLLLAPVCAAYAGRAR